ncbi:hypothetical protein I302_106290 [Kwoniella bestiolae CBS 10118]|uniref:Uncharacterized protein n=1 Tax=Kwoniella bestiolae CBS 10118 TaxID=1296100 RepID=A0AAJ8KB16_9TREE
MNILVHDISQRLVETKKEERARREKCYVDTNEDTRREIDEKRASRKDAYLAEKTTVLKEVVQSHAHLSEQEWEDQANLWPTFHPMSLTGGGETFEKSTRGSSTRRFCSLNYPPTVHLWASDESPEAPRAVLPSESTRGLIMEELGREDTPTPMARPEWDYVDIGFGRIANF